MGRTKLLALVALCCALSTAGCSCGSRHHAHDERTDEGDGFEPNAGKGGSASEDRDGSASGSRDGGVGDGRDGGAGAAFGDAEVELIDPPPVELDLSELIPTSGSHAVVLSGSAEGGATQQLLAIDLASGGTHVLAENDELSFAHASPDGSTILFGGNRSSIRDNFFLARVLDEGVVPATVIEGFADDRGHRGLMGWTEDGRFALLSRTSRVSEHGVDLVDTHKAARHWSTESDRSSSMSGRVAPAGLWLNYIIDGQGASGGFARITANGLYFIEMPELEHVQAYSPSGTRALFNLQVGEHDWRTYTLELRPGAEPMELDAGDEVTHINPLAFWHDDDQVLAHVTYAEGADAIEHIDVRSGAKSSSLLPGADFDVLPNGDGSVLLGSRSIGEDLMMVETELWLIDPFIAHAPSLLTAFTRDLTSFEPGSFVSYGTAGRDHVWYDASADQVTFVAYASDGSAASRDVSAEELTIDCMPDEPWLFEPDHALQLAALSDLGTTLLLIDLSSPLAELVARIESPHGGELSCATWNAAHDALAFVERVDDGESSRSYLYTLQWPSNGAPAQPEIAFESELPLELVVHRP